MVGEDDVATTGARYASGGELGRGGMGVVEAAHDTWLGRSVAVKRPRGSGRDAQLARLSREARITASLLHPAIPPIYDVGEDDQGPFYTMPVLTGTTLHAHLAQQPLHLRATIGALLTACRAVGYAHARGVVHRDLKPANVLLGAHGEVWVLDWGVALDPHAPDDAVVGTDGFRAPEVDAGLRATPRSDVFGLGRMLACALDASAAPAPELRAVVERATAAVPADRYADASALADDLARWLDGHLVEAHDYPLGEVLRHVVWRWRAPLVVAAAAVVALTIVGVGALRVQRVERQRADRSLAVTLAQQADTMRQRGARPESEVLAAHALALDESPLARGVLAAWAESPPLVLAASRPLPCEDPLVEPDGHVVCTGPTLRVFSPDGALSWEAPLPALPVGTEWVGDVAEARRFADGSVVLRHVSNHVQVWRAGVRTAWFRHLAYLRLVDGPVPAVHDAQRVGLLDTTTGEVRWGATSCARIETALIEGDTVVTACRDAELRVGTLDAPGEPVPLPGHPSVIAWSDGPVLGTFEGHVVRRVGDRWEATDAGLGAVRHLVPVRPGLVLLRGEHRDVRLWSLVAGAAVGSVPRGDRAVGSVDGDLLTVGAAVRVWEVPVCPSVTVLEHRSGGGVSALGVSPSGRVVALGSASGEVASWHRPSGVVSPDVPPREAAAKAVVMLDETSFVYAEPAGSLMRFELGAAAPTVASRAVAREVRPLDDGTLAILPWTGRLDLLDATGTLRAVALPAPPVGVVSADALWIVDERGAVHRVGADAASLVFTLPMASVDLARSGDRLIVTEGKRVVAYTQTGQPLWHHDGAAMLTALTASDTWVVAGDVDGRVIVLSPEGALLGGLSGHTRRVAAVVLRGDTLFSGGWDGTVRVWGLASLRLPASDVLDDVTTRWALSREEALAGADPLGLGR